MTITKRKPKNPSTEKNSLDSHYKVFPMQLNYKEHISPKHLKYNPSDLYLSRPLLPSIPAKHIYPGRVMMDRVCLEFLPCLCRGIWLRREDFS